MSRRINRFIIVFGILSLIFGVCTYLVRDTKGNSHYYEGDNSVMICDNIEVQLLKTNLELIPYDGDKIRIQYKSIMPISAKLGDNRLVISESDELKLTFMTGDSDSLALRLYLPRAIYKTIMLSTASGNVSIGRIDSDDITVVTKSGDITATETRSLVNLSSGSGNITLDFESVIGGSSIYTRKGDGEITFPEDSSVALSYKTDTGTFSSSLLSGSVEGSYMYSFGGGAELISAEVTGGTLTVNEKTEEEP